MEDDGPTKLNFLERGDDPDPRHDRRAAEPDSRRELSPTFPWKLFS
jgi:hypothetical protein